jgi:Flp pilus assembly protein TadD
MKDARTTITGNLSTDKKLELLRAAREKCAESSDIAYLLGLAEIESGDLSKGEASIRSAISSNPQASYYAALTNCLIKQAKLIEAAEAVKSGLELDGASAELFNSSGILELKDGKLSSAEALFRRAVAIKPNFVEANFNLGLVLQQEGRFDEAAVSYQQAINLAPGLLEPRFNLANLHLQNDKIDQAERVLKDIPQPGVEKREYWLLKAAIAEKRGALDEAKQSLDRVKTISGDSVELSIAQARLVVVGGDVSGGVQRLTGLRDAHPSSSDVRSALGWALIVEGKKDQAKVELEEALRLDPANHSAKKNLQTLISN